MVAASASFDRAARGFTVLELLVVLAIAALLVALVPPLVSAVVPGARLKVAARELAVDLRDARHRAIARNAVVGVTFRFDPPTYHVDGAPERRAPAGVSFVVAGEESAQISAVEAGRLGAAREAYTLRFFPDGSSTGATIRVVGAEGGYTVDVGWLMGRVRYSEALDGA